MTDSSRQETAAHALEAAASDLQQFVAACPDEVWTRRTPGDGRTVASLAYHCAAGSDVALGWICQMVARRPVRDSPESHDAANDAEAARASGMGKDEVIGTLRRTTARTVAFLRSLTDEELERTAMLGVAGREMSVGQFIGSFGRHMQVHLQALRLALDTR